MRCYICWEETDEKSPCVCNMSVHNYCLLKWRFLSKKEHCSICKHDLVSPHEYVTFQKRRHYLIQIIYTSIIFWLISIIGDETFIITLVLNVTLLNHVDKQYY